MWTSQPTPPDRRRRPPDRTARAGSSVSPTRRRLMPEQRFCDSHGPRLDRVPVAEVAVVRPEPSGSRRAPCGSCRRGADIPGNMRWSRATTDVARSPTCPGGDRRRQLEGEWAGAEQPHRSSREDQVVLGEEVAEPHAASCPCRGRCRSHTRRTRLRPGVCRPIRTTSTVCPLERSTAPIRSAISRVEPCRDAAATSNLIDISSPPARQAGVGRPGQGRSTLRPDTRRSGAGCHAARSSARPHDRRWLSSDPARPIIRGGRGDAGRSVSRGRAPGEPGGRHLRRGRDRGSRRCGPLRQRGRRPSVRIRAATNSSAGGTKRSCPIIPRGRTRCTTSATPRRRPSARWDR